MEGRRSEEESAEREEDRKKKLQEIEKITERELKTIKEEHMNNVEFRDPSYSPDNCRKWDSRIYRGQSKQEDAYNKAIEFILEDPEYHICDIQPNYEDDQSCRLECFIAPRDNAVTFSKKGQDHVLFFSRCCFKQKEVPGRTGVNQGGYYYYYVLKLCKFILWELISKAANSS